MNAPELQPTEPLPNPNYGSGCYRRRIRIDNLRADFTVIALDDDFHAFTLNLRHDGICVTGIESRSIRYPASVCPDAGTRLQTLVGQPLTANRGRFLGYESARQHCTHLHDLLWLAMSQALRGTPSRQYDIAVPDDKDDRTQAEVRVDGMLLHRWTVSNQVVLDPPQLAGTPLRGGFGERARMFYAGDVLEAAQVLQMGCFVSRGRRVDIDSYERLVLVEGDRRIGRCFRFQPEMLARGQSNTHQVRDFSTAPERLLEWHRPRTEGGS